MSNETMKESQRQPDHWIPAYAGMTQTDAFSRLILLGQPLLVRRVPERSPLFMKAEWYKLPKIDNHRAEPLRVQLYICIVW